MKNRTISAWEDALLDSDTTSVSYRVPADHPAFQGHFPGNPVLPGIVQIRLFLLSANRLTGKSWELQEVKRAKFLQPVLPNQTVTVKMSAKACDIFEFTLLTPEGQMHSQAQLQLISQ